MMRTFRRNLNLKASLTAPAITKKHPKGTLLRHILY